MPSNFKALAGAAGGGDLADPNFPNVTLLLHGDGSNGAQNNTFIDSSTNNFTITRNGNTTQGSFSPYGSLWSNYFDGSGDFLQVTGAALAFGSGSWTVEGWIFLNSYPGSYAQIFDSRFNGHGSTAGLTLYVGSNGTLRVYQGTDRAYTSSTISLGTWTHFAAVYDGTTLKLYLNGSNTGATNYTASFNLTNTTLQIGAEWTTTAGFINASISNFRVLVGTALYTANFTPPTAPLTAITNTSLLTCADNRFRDGSTNNFTITRVGDVKVTNFAPFAPSSAYSTTTNGGSAYMDGTGDWLTGSSSIMPSTSTSTFTIEGWVYPTTFANRIDIIGDMSPSVSSDTKVIAAEVNTSGQVALYWFDGAVRRCTGNTAMVLNQWNYFAIVVTSNAIAIYVNRTTADTLSGTTTLTNRTQTHNFALGSYYGEPAFRGYLSNIRVSTVARTISSVPSSPVSSDANTRVLINATNAAIFDNSMKNDLETVGNAQISTSVKKFGTGSMYFDGSGDYLDIVTNQVFAFGTGDFTIEGWFYTNTTSGDRNLVDFRPSGTNGAYPNIFIAGGGYLSYNANGSVPITGGTVINTGTWYHFALARSGTSTKLFLNGTQQGSTYSDSTNYIVGDNRPRIATGGYGAGVANFDGYLDDIRITKGVARYTANFTAPTAPFPNK